MKAARQPKASATAPPIITPSTEPTEAPARKAPVRVDRRLAEKTVSSTARPMLP